MEPWQKQFHSSARISFYAALLISYSLLLIQFFYNRSLWADEAMLSLNLIDRNYIQLLAPLDYYQVAPVLFLYIEKFIISILGDSELALRLFPLTCAMVSVPLTYSLVVAVSGRRNLALCAMILLALTPSFLYYSSEVKQYCSDITVFLVLANILYCQWTPVAARRLLLLIVAGVAAIFLSNVSVVSVFTLGILLTIESWIKKRPWVFGWLPHLFWVMAFSINYLFFIKDHPHAVFMKHYWQQSFLPLNPASLEFRKFINRTVLHVFRDLLPSLPSYGFVLTLLLYLAGLVFLFLQKQYKVLFICCFPVIVHLALSALQLYPFDERLILYQLPLYVIVISVGIINLSKSVFDKKLLSSLSIVALIAILTMAMFSNYPIRRHEIKPAIAYINAASRPGESMYVFRGATPATKYYMKTARASFEQLKITWGARRLNGLQDYLNDLNRMRGRTWLLVSHIYPFTGEKTEETTLIMLLQRQGSLLQQRHFYGSSVYLFDFK